MGARLGADDLLLETAIPMNKQRILEIAGSAMSERRDHPAREKGYILNHGLRTGKLVLKLAEVIDKPVDVSRDVLFVAAVFHDIGKGDEPHNETGAALTERLVTDECSPEEISAITQLIVEHNQRSQASEDLLASRILQDADILDHFGTQSIWLRFLWSATYEETPEEPLRCYKGEENQQWLIGVRKSLNFDTSRDIFDKRLRFESNFFELFEREIDGQI